MYWYFIPFLGVVIFLRRIYHILFIRPAADGHLSGHCFHSWPLCCHSGMPYAYLNHSLWGTPKGGTPVPSTSWVSLWGFPQQLRQFAAPSEVNRAFEFSTHWRWWFFPLKKSGRPSWRCWGGNSLRIDFLSQDSDCLNPARAGVGAWCDGSEATFGHQSDQDESRHWHLWSCDLRQMIFFFLRP